MEDYQPSCYYFAYFDNYEGINFLKNFLDRYFKKLSINPSVQYISLAKYSKLEIDHLH